MEWSTTTTTMALWCDLLNKQLWIKAWHSRGYKAKESGFKLWHEFIINNSLATVLLADIQFMTCVHHRQQTPFIPYKCQNDELVKQEKAAPHYTTPTLPCIYSSMYVSNWRQNWGAQRYWGKDLKNEIIEKDLTAGTELMFICCGWFMGEGARTPRGAWDICAFCIAIGLNWLIPVGIDTHTHNYIPIYSIRDNHSIILLGLQREGIGSVK